MSTKTYTAESLPRDAFHVGDVITVKGASVPRDLWPPRQFRVIAVDERGLPKLQLIPLNPNETQAEFSERAREMLRRVKAQ